MKKLFEEEDKEAEKNDQEEKAEHNIWIDKSDWFKKPESKPGENIIVSAFGPESDGHIYDFENFLRRQNLDNFVDLKKRKYKKVKMIGKTFKQRHGRHTNTCAYLDISRSCGNERREDLIALYNMKIKCYAVDKEEASHYMRILKQLLDEGY
ncbi:hypothetical protein L1987_04669 [Smallanthus sonchifolius]|uniref:Uncharacterized protein n=1 Tax=Smallanthus sonchifolius TaxID=185202 RepID=A0ACB9JT75_9ASTR|nr:hypothetical protein L1987_04669 [Smallanthus sonchifolius]